MTDEAKGLGRARVLSDAEVSRILERAADFQQRSETRVTGSVQGLTVEDLREIAREAGIDPQFIDLAVAQGRSSLEPKGHPLYGGTYSWRFHSQVPGTLSPEDRSRLVQEVRSLLEEQGELTEIYGRMEWRHDDTMGPVTVSVYPKDRTIEIDVAANRGGEAGSYVFVGTLLGAFPGVFFLASTLNFLVDMGTAPALFVTGIGAVSLAASFGISRMVWRLRSSWWARRLRRMSDQLSSTVQDMALASAAAEEDRVTPLELPAALVERSDDT